MYWKDALSIMLIKNTATDEASVVNLMDSSLSMNSFEAESFMFWRGMFK